MRLEENVLFEDKVSSIVQAPHLKEIKIKGGKNEVENHSDREEKVSNGTQLKMKTPQKTHSKF